MSKRPLLGNILPANARCHRFAVGSVAATVASMLIASTAFADELRGNCRHCARSAARTSRMCRSPSRPSPADTLRSKGLTDLHALSNLTPNVNLDGGAPFSGDTSVLSASIRGIGQDDFAFNLDPGVGVYLDGVYLARTIGANQNLLGCGSHRDPQGSARHAVRTQHHRRRDQHRHPHAGYRIEAQRQRDRGPVQPPRRSVDAPTCRSRATS